MELAPKGGLDDFLFLGDRKNDYEAEWMGSME